MTQHIRAVSRALTVLQCFSHEAPELTLAELSGRAGLSKSTVLRLLLTLEEHGFVQHDPLTSKYALGLSLVELGAIALEHLDLRRAARPLLELLREQTQESVSLTVMGSDQVLYVEMLESPQPVKIAARPGRRLPAHCTGTGRAFLAFGPEADVERILSQELKAYTPYTVTNPGELRQIILETRERGFAVSEQEFELGITGVGAPIWGANGRVAGVIGVVGPSYRIPPERALQLGKEARDTADAISRQIGAPPGVLQHPAPQKEIMVDESSAALRPA